MASVWGKSPFYQVLFLGIWGWILTDFQCLGLGWVKHSANQLSGPEATSDCTQTSNPLTNGLCLRQIPISSTIFLEFEVGFWRILNDWAWDELSTVPINCLDMRLPLTAHRPEIHSQMALAWGKYLAHVFFWKLRMDFERFCIPGLGINWAQFKSIWWIRGYLRWHTDPKSTHKWPQHGANTHFNNHFPGFWGWSLMDFECLGLG